MEITITISGDNLTGLSWAAGANEKTEQEFVQGVMDNACASYYQQKLADDARQIEAAIKAGEITVEQIMALKG